MRTAITLLLVVVISVLAIAGITHGFRVVTSEGARRLVVAENPQLLPDATLRYADGRRATLHDALAGDGRIVLVDFIYTRCESICLALGNEFQQLQRRILAAGLQDRVRLLSISFDPAHDTPAVLARYSERLDANAAVWHFASPDNAALAPLLDAFGIVVIGDGNGGFIHNAAIHLVQPDGRLARIFDAGANRPALHTAARLNKVGGS